MNKALTEIADVFYKYNVDIQVVTVDDGKTWFIDMQFEDEEGNIYEIDFGDRLKDFNIRQKSNYYGKF